MEGLYIILFEKNKFCVMNKQTFIVSDESLNSYGMVILTAGIDYADFARNPIMYYMHERSKGVVGRWENIRVEDNKLLMDAVFDDSTELGKQIATQVRNGFLRCASIGIENPEVEYLNGVETVVKCRLREVSIVDVPANRSAIKLFDQGGKEVVTLAECMGKRTDLLRRTIIAYLGLSDRADDSEILQALEMAVKSPKMPENAVSRAIRLNLIDKEDEEQYKTLAMSDIKAFDEIVARKEARAKANFEAVFMSAARDGRLDARNKAVFEDIANTGGYALCERVISMMRPPIRITDVIEGKREIASGNIPPRSQWGLREYRRYAPNELADNPGLYAELMERESLHAPLTEKNLDYYRRHNPKYLEEHPKEYQRLMAERKQTKG